MSCVSLTLWADKNHIQIDKSHAENKLPILVGGTSYWVHHLLFPQSLPANPEHLKRTSAPQSPELSHALMQLPQELLSLYNNMPTYSISAKESPERAYNMYELLSHLDPEMAKRWHWKDTRKVQRNIEIIKERGMLASKVIKEAYANSGSRLYVSFPC